MTDFDPMATDYDGGADDYPEPKDLDEAGTYLLAFVYFHEMRTSANGNPFARFKLEVLHGSGAKSGQSKAGSVMWESVFLNARSFKRLAALCRAMGYTERFNPVDEEALKHAMLGRPFLAKVKIEVNGKYRDARVKWTEARDWSDAEKAAAAKFEQAWSARALLGNGSAAAPNAGSFSDDNVPF